VTDQIEADDAALCRAAKRMARGVTEFREFPPEDRAAIVRAGMRWREAFSVLVDMQRRAGADSMALGEPKASVKLPHNDKP